MSALERITGDVSRDDVRDWDFDELPQEIERTAGGHVMHGYPALVEESGNVAIRVFDTPERQRSAMWSGTRRLILNTMPSPARGITGGLTQEQRLTLSRTPHGSPTALLEDCTAAAVDVLMQAAGGPAWDKSAFETLRSEVRQALPATARGIVERVERIIGDAHAVELRLAEAVSGAAAFRGVATQLRALVYPGFVTATPPAQLRQLRRYLQAMSQRLEDAATNPARDRDRQAQVDVVVADLTELRGRLGDRHIEQLDQIRWMIEEFRVSLFAQKLGTAYPISVARIHKAMDDLDPR
jgi:ATP-dependent helicase HrpA